MAGKSAVSLGSQPLGARTCPLTSRLVSASALIGAGPSSLNQKEKKAALGPGQGSGGPAWLR